MPFTDKFPLPTKLRLKRMLSVARSLRTRKRQSPAEPSIPTDPQKQQILVLEDLVPAPDLDAGSARMMHILLLLSRDWHVVFIAIHRGAGRERYEQQLHEAGIELVNAIDLSRLLKRRPIEVVILSRPDIAGPMIDTIRRIAPDAKIVYDMLDVHHLRATREAELTGSPQAAKEAEKYRRIESRTARLADILWCGSSSDQEIMRVIAPNVQSVVVPTIHELRETGSNFEDRSDLVFVGNFAHRPNVDSVHFLGNEIMPLVRESLPNVELSIIGANAPVEFARYSTRGVRVLGYVPDLAAILSAARIFVAPIRFGSGVNGKIGEALARGLPVVTTSIGAEGWGFGPDDLLIADDPAAFATAVSDLYTDRDLWHELAIAGRKHIADHCTSEVIARVIHKSLQQ